MLYFRKGRKKMFDIHAFLGILAGVIAFLAYVLYIVAIVRGSTKPSRTTWWIWSILGIIVGISYFLSGAEHTIWVPLGEVVGPLIIALLSLKYGVGGWSPIDKFAIFGSIVSLILWGISGSPLVGLVAGLSIDFLAVIPTAVKTYYRPEEEDRFAWSLTGLGNFLNLFAVEKWVFAIAVYPVYAAIIDGVVLALLFRKKKNVEYHGE